jgi:ABC-type transport system substrate-binding protein
MATIWIYPPYPDPYNFFFPLMDSSNAGNGGVNFSFYENDDVDAMIEAAASATDEQVRADTYGELQELFVREVPYVPVVVGYNMSAGQKWLQGYKYSPTHNATIDIYSLVLDGKP